ncbi:MAG: DNA topoisomerase I, partial [Chitinophagaceae bacterium]|nr:DNA topoisomerase I [Chitinophagaceae bacterium]
ARYTEASLVKKLEELGIGRPSTYAPTISTIIKRNYVEKRDKEGVKRDIRIVKLKNDKINKVTVQENTGAEKSKLFPTDLGLVVTDFLKQHFDEVMDYSFTANIEEEFDKIAEGKQQWSKMVGNFYTPFHKGVEHTLENADRAKGERELGIDAVSGKPIIARMGRYGPMVQIGVQEDEEKPRFAKLKPAQSIETISLEQALELFKLPRNLGKFEDEDVQVSIGKFGPYASHNKKFYSLDKEMDPYTVELEKISPMIAEKRTAKNERTLKIFEKEKIQILKGPYGPYIKQGLRNYKLNKEQQEKAANLTIEEVKQIIEHLKANPPKKSARRKKK